MLADRPAAVLEVGCGRGVALPLLLAAVGTVHAADRSATAVAACAARLPDEVASGRLVLHHAAWADLDVPPVDAVLAVDVNALWTGDGARELSVVRRVLRPGGVLHLVHAPPPGRLAEVRDRVLATLRAHGFDAAVDEGDAVVRLRARPVQVAPG